ncbi:OmpA family protein [Aestuariibius sp. 2305UL40-4]|uniref:OmpA family protein n=1 Tax=Aestuariibius violaceus TaxID=3234132 RepID=UPI00345F1038
MRLSSALIMLAVFGTAAGGSLLAARLTVETVEDLSASSVNREMTLEGLDWASVQTDGLQVIIEGTAPTEATMFRAITTASKVVDAARVRNEMFVADAAAIEPPRFSIEILRNTSEISLIGLIPASDDRDAILEEVASAADGLPVTDLLETADYPAPEGWQPALTYALRALDTLPRSKISVEAGRVEATAISESPQQKREYENQLRRRVPENIEVALDISAPRPVITPFTLRFVIDDRGPHFDACSVDGDTTEEMIEAAARAIGWQGTRACTEGLGMPSQTWGEAVAMGIAALGDLGGGALTFTDTDVSLVAAEGTAQGLFDNVVGEFENALPEVYALTAVLPEPPDASVEIPEFIAIRSPEGLVQLRGKVSDELMNTTAENYARARLGAPDLAMGTRISEDLPSGWSVRVLAGIEALAELSNGAVTVQPDLITIRGNTGDQQASAQIAALLTEKLGDGQDFQIDVTYVEQLDPIAGLPTAEECIAQIEAVVEEVKITFEPGSATLDSTAQPIMDDIAAILQPCADKRIEVAGYTDSQGREVMNQQLSQERAEAVLNALRERRVPTRRFTAIGYGEADPIADNGTEEGREANRRIEFRLIVPESTEETTALEEMEAPLEEASDPAEAAPNDQADPAPDEGATTEETPSEDPPAEEETENEQN